MHCCVMFCLGSWGVGRTDAHCSTEPAHEPCLDAMLHIISTIIHVACMRACYNSWVFSKNLATVRGDAALNTSTRLASFHLVTSSISSMFHMHLSCYDLICHLKSSMSAVCRCPHVSVAVVLLLCLGPDSPTDA